jgi:hypothetical protein
VGVGTGLLDQIANEVLGVVAKHAVGLGAEGVGRVAGPGLEPLLVEADLAVLDEVLPASHLKKETRKIAVKIKPLYLTHCTYYLSSNMTKVVQQH